jgi:hypothetical protein
MKEFEDAVRDYKTAHGMFTQAEDVNDCLKKIGKV